MVKVENFPNAYKEVYEILKAVPQQDLEKIPKKFMAMVEKNMNKEYDFCLDNSIDFLEEQELMEETNTILAYIFLHYWATEDQREKIEAKFKKDIEKVEQEKRELYDVDVFKNKRQAQENNEQKLEMVVYKKESIITRIFNKIKSFFRNKILIFFYFTYL